MVQGEARQLPQAIADLAGQVVEAANRIRQSVTETPVEQITGLVPEAGVDVIFKLENLQQTGSFKLRGASNKILSLSAEQAARAAATAQGKVFISPYNDVQVMAGQGTLAVELLRQVPSIDALFVAVGGGGLIGGVGAYMKHASPATEIVGCWPENSRVLLESIKAGRIVDIPEQPTLSESTEI